jgi:hypothetical protein
MENSMKAISNRIREMERAFTTTRMGICMKESGQMIRELGRERSSSQTTPS